MIDHVSIAVRDIAISGPFYDAALAPIGYRRLITYPDRVGFGKTYPEIWLNSRPGMAAVDRDTGAHVCLRARSSEAVDAFHKAALLQGGRDDGPPGPRKAAMVTYYGAFIRDPDGNRLEVMTVPAQ